jgi:tRNA(Ile)-lysidine synthase
VSRSHPPSLRSLVERIVRDEGLFARGAIVLCACSGGPDSTALLHALALLRKRLGHEVVAHGVDHGLRPEAAAELGLAQQVAEAVGVSFTITQLHVEPGGNLQARAREARLQALAAAAVDAGATTIATGHTADDRAETLLMRLLRGSGPRGLAVLPPTAPLPVALPAELAAKAPLLIRPLLRARRADVLAHLARHRLQFAQDPSNADPRFTRVRVRRELVPLLEDLAPGVVEHLCSLADMLVPEADALASLGLGRAQRQAIERAQRLGRKGVELRVRGGRCVEATFPGGQIVLNEK